MVVHGQKWVLWDLWPNWCPEGLLANCGSKGLMANSGSGGSECGLGPTWLPPLAPFGLIGLGQKGPEWPTDRTDRRPRPTGDRSRRGPKWPKKAISAQTPLMKGGGPEPRIMARGPGDPWKTKGPPRPKIKSGGLGVGEVEIGQEGQ
ncbi:hypothetical protein O181_068780 [Austropuccinia psidii MF-1]|uniref:Uncharacterized protein n=1 Tax=Austropuccinia psidii MF-1 TaxID=1389203 RepID=A0A9Q3ET71_9BASI|nr:hypothetical protein [Austropuccinia psidii MF-1]